MSDYKPILSIRETEIAIKLLKDFFQLDLATTLNLTRVSAPLFVHQDGGLNDMLSGKEVPVYFKAPGVNNDYLEIVHSLAKWKRMALHEYDFELGEGLYTDMNAIRREETLDNIHSLYVDQWDWEKIISPDLRTTAYLHTIVTKIYHVLLEAEQYIIDFFPQLGEAFLPEKIHFTTTEELFHEFPDLDDEGREYEAAKKYGAIFIQGIGHDLPDGQPHSMRSPDYDDWRLNGDIIVWNPVIERHFELSSMGIRVDSGSLSEQLELSNSLGRMQFVYHQKVADDILPLTIGGGIGQSRLCMLLLKKAHIGEVQASIWDEETKQWAREKKIPLL